MDPGAQDTSLTEEHNTAILQPGLSWTVCTPPLKEEQQPYKNTANTTTKIL